MSNSKTHVSPRQVNSNLKSSVDKIRVSSGSAIVMGLISGFLKAKPTTIYLLTYRKGKCNANCGFCSQAKSSKTQADMLSRVTWPVFTTEEVLLKLAATAKKGDIKRICIQALNYVDVLEDLIVLVKEMKVQGVEIPISISFQPLNKREMKRLVKVGVDRIGIALDGATKEVFSSVKGSAACGPYTWDRQREVLLEAVKIFGKGKVSTHLIVGLGETEKDMLGIIQWCVDKSIYPALFSFTPISGTALENVDPPTIEHYRRIQIARYLIVNEKTKFSKLGFDDYDRIVSFGVSHEEMKNIIQSGKPFLTSGCPGCNRPYYNEKPSGPFYNFPVQPIQEEIAEIKKQLESV